MIYRTGWLRVEEARVIRPDGAPVRTGVRGARRRPPWSRSACPSARRWR